MTAIPPQPGDPLRASRIRQRKLRRWVGGILLLGIIVGTGLLVKYAIDRMQINRLQSACMFYVEDAKQIVYEDDLGVAAQLFALDSQYVPAPWATGHPAVRFASAWERFSAAVNPPARLPAATVYLHERHCKDGPSRLVAVEARWINEPWQGVFALQSLVYAPGTLLRSPRCLSDDTWRPPVKTHAPRIQRFFSGQSDPDDRSRFVVRWVIDSGKSLTLIGQLTEKDTIVWTMPPELQQHNDEPPPEEPDPMIMQQTDTQ